jgi:RNA polymerase sigma-70 factor (ECF subfamily)
MDGAIGVSSEPRTLVMSRTALSSGETGALYRQFGHLVLRRARVLLRDDDLANDVLQEVFIKVMRYGAQIREAASKLRWLYRVSDRCCFDALSRRKRLRPTELPPELESPSSLGAETAARNAILAFLDRLDDLDRNIAVLAWLDELPQDEIATEVGRSRQTVNKRLGIIRERALAFGARHA